MVQAGSAQVDPPDWNPLSVTQPPLVDADISCLLLKSRFSVFSVSEITHSDDNYYEKDVHELL